MHRLLYARQYQRKDRAAKRKEKEKVKQQQREQGIHPADQITVYPTIGRPRAEMTMRGDLVEVMQSIANENSSGDARRRGVQHYTNHSARTFAKEEDTDLVHAVIFRRTMAVRVGTQSSKAHHTTTNIRFRKPQNSHTAEHASSHYCASTRKSRDSLYAMLGNKDVMYVEIDNKATVPVGKTMASKQGKFLMGFYRQVRLSDHDFPAGPSHSYTPSAYKFFELKDGAFGDHVRVSWNGDAMCKVRNNYFDTATAHHHWRDLDSIFRDPRFDKWTKREDGTIKPILIIRGDNGPDEGCEKVKVQQGIIWLRQKWDFDLITMTNSYPGGSRWNRIERHFSKMTECVVGKELPIQHFGSHLKNGKVVNQEMCRMNLDYAGAILAKQWDGMIQAGFVTHSEYVPALSIEEQKVADAEFADIPLEKYKDLQHCRTGKFVFQLRRCTNENCDLCKTPALRSNVQLFLPGVFVPPPVMLDSDDPSKLLARNKMQKKTHYLSLSHAMALKVELFKLPEDYYNPLVSDDDLQIRQCPFCKMSFPSKAALDRHRRFWHKYKRRGFFRPQQQQLDLQSQHEQATQEVVEVLRHQSDGYYMVLLADDTREWLQLTADHEKVREYMAKVTEQQDVMIIGEETEHMFYGQLRQIQSEQLADESSVDPYHCDYKNMVEQKKLKREIEQECDGAHGHDDACLTEKEQAHRKRRRIDHQARMEQSDWDTGQT